MLGRSLRLNSRQLELLHSACFKAAIEGELEPVYFQGEIVGHIKKFDSSLQIELLRAHMPAKFKTPGGAMQRSTSTLLALKGSFVDAAVQAELIAMRQENLRAIQEKKAKAIELGDK